MRNNMLIRILAHLRIMILIMLC